MSEDIAAIGMVQIFWGQEEPGIVLGVRQSSAGWFENFADGVIVQVLEHTANFIINLGVWGKSPGENRTCSMEETGIVLVFDNLAVALIAQVLWITEDATMFLVFENPEDAGIVHVLENSAFVQ